MDEFRTALLPFAPRQRSLGARLLAFLTPCRSWCSRVVSRFWPARTRSSSHSSNSSVS
jgi:hypothetical protein